jgi:hypothetical protein
MIFGRDSSENGLGMDLDYQNRVMKMGIDVDLNIEGGSL